MKPSDLELNSKSERPEGAHIEIDQEPDGGHSLQKGHQILDAIGKC